MNLCPYSSQLSSAASVLRPLIATAQTLVHSSKGPTPPHRFKCLLFLSGSLVASFHFRFLLVENRSDFPLELFCREIVPATKQFGTRMGTRT